MRMAQSTDALSRRHLLTGTGAALALSALPGCAGTTAVARKKIGLQLYTVRAPMAQDMPGTLRRLRAIGYDEMEFAGYFNTPPAEVKRLLADIGLTAPSAHVSRELIRDNPMPSIEAGATIGHEWLVLNWLAPEERQTLDQYRAWADVCNRFAAQCHDAGMKFCYHNHDFEFHPIDGVVPYDLLLERTDHALVNFELDLYWARKSGRDVAQLLTAQGARIPMCHVKDMDAQGAMADVGAGQIDFAGLFARKSFEHYFVERDDAPDPLASAEASYRGLSRIFATPGLA
jgi:sugar phosphate isomerase/epimerase